MEEKDEPKKEKEPRYLTYKESKSFFIEINKRMSKHFDALKKMGDNHRRQKDELNKLIFEIKNAFSNIYERMESWEESLLYTYHNIKKNQFLYAHYPDAWAKNYHDIKDGLKNENEYLDKEIEARG